MNICPKAPRGKEWRIVRDEDGIPTQMIWLGLPPPVDHAYEPLLYGYERCIWCSVVVPPEQAVP